MHPLAFVSEQLRVLRVNCSSFPETGTKSDGVISEQENVHMVPLVKNTSFDNVFFVISRAGASN